MSCKRLPQGEESITLLGLVLGMAVWCLVALGAGPYLYGSVQVAALPGLAAGLWAVWLQQLPARMARERFLNPRPVTCSMPLAQAVSRLQEFFGRGNTRYAEPWTCLDCDAGDGLIVYETGWTETVVTGTSGVYIKVEQKTERLRRSVNLEIRLSEIVPGSTVVQLNWRYSSPGNPSACDPFISQTTAELGELLGPCLPAPSTRLGRIAAPPWALLAVTALMLGFLFADTLDDIERLRQLQAGRDAAVAEAGRQLQEEVAAVEWELGQWEKHRARLEAQ